MTGARDEAYAALGLPPGAPFEEVRKRFLSLATQLHPDKAPSTVETAEFSALRCVGPPTRGWVPSTSRRLARFRSLATRRMMGSTDGAQTDRTHAGLLASRWRRAAFEQIADVQRSAQPTAVALSKPTHKACGAAAFAQGEHALACEFFQQVRWVPLNSFLSLHALHSQ